MKKRLVVLAWIVCIIALGGALLTGCKPPNLTQAENGNVVKVDYIGKLADGTVFDTSKGKQTLEFTVGAGQMIPGFDKAVVGMRVGDTKTVTIPADEAYGQPDPNLIQEVPKSQLEGIVPKVGMKLQAYDNANNLQTFTITAVSDTTVTVDGNNELAGKNLTFEITMRSIK